MIITPAKFRARIDRSLKKMKPRRDQAARFTRAYMGDYGINPRKSMEGDDRDDASVNFVYSYVETICPTIFSGDPRFYLEEKNAASRDSKYHAQELTNYWFRELALKKHLFRCRLDWLLSGFAAILTDWDYEEEEIEIPNVLHADPMTGKPVMGEPKVELSVKRDQPLLRRLDPWDVLLDADAKTSELHQWRGHREAMLYSEFCKLDGVGSEIKNKIQPSSIPRDFNRGPFDNNEDYGTEKEWVLVDHIYDLHNEKVLLLPVGEEVNSYVSEEDWPWSFEVQDDRWPITILEGKFDPENPYPFSEFLAFWNQIQERNRLRTLFQSHTRRLVPGWIMKKGALDEEQKKKFTAHKTDELLEALNPEGIMAKPQPTLPPDLYNHERMVGDDLVNTSLFYEYNNDSIADTATEASLLNSRGNISKTERRQRFEDFVSIIGGKVHQLCAQFQDIEVAIKIKNPKNPQDISWIGATKEEIQGEFDYRFKPGIVQQQDEGLAKQQWLKFMELMAANKYTNQRYMAERGCETFDSDPDKALLSEEQVQKNDEMAAAAAEAEAKGNEKPPLGFSDIKFETLPTEIQAMILQAAMQQNGAAPGGGGGAVPSPSTGPIPSLDIPPQNEIMAGPDVNQAPPPMAGAGLPPPTAVQPISEFQGG